MKQGEPPERMTKKIWQIRLSGSDSSDLPRSETEKRSQGKTPKKGRDTAVTAGSGEGMLQMNRVIIPIAVPPLRPAAVLSSSASLSLSLQELLMYSGVRMVAPPLMEFPIFSFLHRPRSSSLGFARLLCRSSACPFARSILELLACSPLHLLVTPLPANLWKSHCCCLTV